MDVNVVKAEALVVGPDDKLVIRLPHNAIEGLADDEVEPFVNSFHEGLSSIIGKDRYIILLGDVEMAKVEAAPGGIPADYAEAAE